MQTIFANKTAFVAELLLGENDGFLFSNPNKISSKKFEGRKYSRK
jgi:hypothetical protein